MPGRPARQFWPIRPTAGAALLLPPTTTGRPGPPALQGPLLCLWLRPDPHGIPCRFRGDGPPPARLQFLPGWHTWPLVPLHPGSAPAQPAVGPCPSALHAAGQSCSFLHQPLPVARSPCTRLLSGPPSTPPHLSHPNGVTRRTAKRAAFLPTSSRASRRATTWRPPRRAWGWTSVSPTSGLAAMCWPNMRASATPRCTHGCADLYWCRTRKAIQGRLHGSIWHAPVNRRMRLPADAPKPPAPTAQQTAPPPTATPVVGLELCGSPYRCC